MTIQEYIRQSKDRFEKAGLHCSDPKQHAEQLVLRTLNLTSTELFLKKNESLLSSDLSKLDQVLERRILGEPLQYILGFEYFYESSFQVGPGCLIPRKETELLVDEILSFQPKLPLRVAELGAGSGNIGISVMLKRPEGQWRAFEINPSSAMYAKKNAEKLLSKQQGYFLHEEDFFEGVHKFSPYDVLVSNPPYISSKEYEALPIEVKKEPELALKAENEGFEVIKKLIEAIPCLLKPGGLFLCEIGASQGEILNAEFKGSFEKFEILKDLAGLSRVLKIINCVRSEQ